MNKLRRLYQPRHPLFWMMVMLNLLSAALAWIVQNRPLATPAMLMVAVFAIGNGLLGTWMAWRLLQHPTEAERAARGQQVGQPAGQGGSPADRQP